MNRFLVFSFIYLCTLLFCIFARIESWPFSDYRVFQYNNHPASIAYYVPFFRLSNGEYFNPVTRDWYLNINRVYFYKAFKEMDSQTFSAYFKSTAQSKKVKDFVRKMREADKDPVKFVAMKVTFKQGKTKHDWSPVYSPVKEYDLY